MVPESKGISPQAVLPRGLWGNCLREWAFMGAFEACLYQAERQKEGHQERMLSWGLSSLFIWALKYWQLGVSGHVVNPLHLYSQGVPHKSAHSENPCPLSLGPS